MERYPNETIVRLPVDSIALEGSLTLPPQPRGIVLFAHGTGSSRHSPRNIYVSRFLLKKNIATLLFDLLTEEEDLLYENRFNIDLITERLMKTTEWIMKQPNTQHLPLGYFGASTGSAAALKTAAKFGEKIKAIVSRGGRPDLAEAMLDRVTAPTLLIVGGADEVVIDLNQRAYKELNTEKELSIIPGATHLFEEPGALEQVAGLAAEWFIRYFASNTRRKDEKTSSADSDT